MPQRNTRKDWKAITWDYDYILSLSDEVECPYYLSEREVGALLTFMQFMGWKTRWYSDLNTNISEDLIQALKDGISDKLMRDDDCPSDPCEDGCVDYLPNAGFIRYEPNDPFRTPLLLPDGYTYIPWYTNPAIPLPGVIPTDAMVNGLAVFAPDLPASGFPRFSFEFDGRGEVEIELVNVPAGGFCLVVIDEDVTKISIVNTSSNILDIVSLAGILAALGIDSEDANVVDTDVVELDIETVGHHRIDVTYLPNFGGETFLGFGGGLRRITFCGPVQVVEEMYLQRQSPEDECLIEQSTDGGITWQEAWRMDNCCDDPTHQRINDDGYLETSEDGETWIIDKTGDTRFSNPTLPPIPSADEETRCAAANSIVSALETKQGDDLAKKELGGTVADFIAALVGFLIAAGVVTGGVTAVLAVIATAIGVLVFHISNLDFENAFSSTTWDDLLCIVFCNMDDDGGISEAQWAAIQGKVSDEISGYAGQYIKQYIQALGPVGLTNIGRQLIPGTKDCDLCECDALWCYLFDFAEVEAQQGWSVWARATGGGGLSDSTWNGSGWASEPTGGAFPYNDDIQASIKRTFTDSFVASVTINWSGGNSGLNFGCRVQVVKSDNTTQEYNSNGVGMFTKVQAINQAIKEIRISIEQSGTQSGFPPDIIISDVQFNGDGTNPIGTDNCE